MKGPVRSTPNVIGIGNAALPINGRRPSPIAPTPRGPAMPAARTDPDAPLKPDAIYGPGEYPNNEVIGRNLEWLAWLMDRSIPVPGTPFKIGLDAILGLFP